MHDFRSAAMTFRGHHLTGELPHKASLAYALDAVDQHQAVFRIPLADEILETSMERRQLRSPAGEMKRTRSVSAKQHHAIDYRHPAQVKLPKAMG